MPLVAAAVCPHPPLLVPELAGAAAPELDEVRAGCDAALADLLSTHPDILAVVGVGPATTALDPPYTGDLTRYGLDLRIGPGGGDELPLSLLIAAWLLERNGYGGPLAMWSVAADESLDGCAQLGREIADGPVDVGDRSGWPVRGERIALLAMGDGSACRTAAAPGYADPRAEAYDQVVDAALAAADVDGLAALDPDLARELLVAGRAPWQVLAAAAHGQRWRTTSHHASAPYGVGYFATAWLPVPPDGAA